MRLNYDFNSKWKSTYTICILQTQRGIAVMTLPSYHQHLLHCDIIISKSQEHLMWLLLTH